MQVRPEKNIAFNPEPGTVGRPSANFCLRRTDPSGIVTPGRQTGSHLKNPKDKFKVFIDLSFSC
jgi:hypothetical protein